MFCPCTGSCPMYCTGYDDGLDHPVYISSRQQKMTEFKSVVRGPGLRARAPFRNSDGVVCVRLGNGWTQLTVGIMDHLPVCRAGQRR